MTDRDIVIDRMDLLADIIKNIPQISDELFTAVSEEETAELRALLQKLTDKAEVIIYGDAEQRAKDALPAGFPDVELADNETVCIDCEQFCRISWDEAGNISGARCQYGYEAAKQLIKGH